MSQYLIIFNLESDRLSNNYNIELCDANISIKYALEKYGFENIQGNVYMGNEGISEAHATIAIQEVSYKFDWFNPCVSNIRFYRLDGGLNAQFISDSAYEAKQLANEKLSLLHEHLIEIGLSKTQIEKAFAKRE